MNKGWKIVRQVSQIGDRVLNIVIALILICAMLFSGYAIYDNLSMIREAKVDDTIIQYRPADDGEADNPSLSELQAINPDVIGWLTVDDTAMDYPVVIGESNQTYLNWDVYGEFSLSGSIFLDYRNDRDFNDFYSLIYGHHMAGNVMFGQLPEFLEEDFFQSHATGTIYLPERTIRIQWYACLETDAYDSWIFYPSYANDESVRQELLDRIEALAVRYRELGVTVDDQIIALSTCYNDTTAGRCVLVGRVMN